MTRHAAAKANGEKTHDEGVCLTEQVISGNRFDGPFLGANVSRLPIRDGRGNTGKLDLYFHGQDGVIKRTWHFNDVLDVQMGLLRYALAVGWQGRIVWGL
jgi:hypothetical protein